MRKQQIPTRNVYELQALCNEAAMAEQREATITAALALPEAERYKLFVALSEQFDSDGRRINTYERNRRIEYLQSRIMSGQIGTPANFERIQAELRVLQGVTK